MMNLQHVLQDFFHLVANGVVEIYNEFSLQHEVGCYIRSVLSAEFKVQFERPTEFFGIAHRALEKKEIDIVVFSDDKKAAIELKFPRNGQYPEQMFKACQDIRFLEQLCDAGFEQGLFVMVADDDGFYSPKRQNNGIYRFFRAGYPLHGSVRKPTGSQEHTLTFRGTYQITWSPIRGSLRYALVLVTQNSG